MDKNAVINTAQVTVEAFDNYKKSNPLLVRKQFQMKDVYFRRNSPKNEILKFELSFDFEQYVIVLLLIASGMYIVLKIMHGFRRRQYARRLRRKK